VERRRIEMHIERDHEQHRIGKLALEIKLPAGFPEKHREAVIRAADLCSVKKHIFNPPAFEIRTV
jgi:putative redox protein